MCNGKNAVFFSVSLLFLQLIGCSRIEPSERSSLESAKRTSTDEGFAQSPIGDNTNCDVYFFIKDYLLKSLKKQNEYDIHALVRSEMELESLARKDKKYLFKSYSGGVVETELSHVLNALCRAHPWCYQITIFSQNGVSIACSNNKDDAIFESKDNINKDNINKDDIYERLGFLYPNANHRIRIEELTRANRGHGRLANKPKYFKVVRAIYYNKDRDCAYFLTKKENNDRIIGYISYIVEE
ncbi:MAG: hypothetical protein LBG13_03185 [Holosporales bacterium]|nr:hypothetical protein [Holosporales bacterium]